MDFINIRKRRDDDLDPDPGLQTEDIEIEIGIGIETGTDIVIVIGITIEVIEIETGKDTITAIGRKGGRNIGKLQSLIMLVLLLRSFTGMTVKSTDL